MANETQSNSGIAIVFGASGGIGSALVTALCSDAHYTDVLAFSRKGPLTFDLIDEPSIETAAAAVARRGLPVRTIIDATGALSAEGCVVEKSWRQIDPLTMARAFQINAIGPALLMKHFLPLLSRDGKSVFATLSARVGSIGDNQLGGWYSYRAAKAALNQLVRNAAIELRRSRPEALCVAIHPGTVATPLTAGYAKTGLEVQTPDTAAMRILEALAGLNAAQSGGFFDNKGRAIPW